MAKRKITTKSTDGEFRVSLNGAESFIKMGFDFGGAGRPNKPYSQVEWVWICVNKIIDVSKSIQMMLATGDDKIVESGPVYDFLFNNKELPFSKLISETVGYYSLFREVYWIFSEKNGVSPTKLLVVGPDQCKPEIVYGAVVGYKLHLPGGNIIPLFLEDVWPIMNFNPDIKYHGSGPTEAGQISISSNYQAGLFNEATLGNGARLSTLLTMPAGTKLNDDEKRALKGEFENTHKGARNAGKTFLATGGLDVKQLSQSMVDMQMMDLRKFDASTICALFGVPTEIVSLNSETQYAHGPATQRFILYTIEPILNFIAQHLTLGIIWNFRFKEHTGVNIKESKYYCGTQVALRQKVSYRNTKIKAIQAGQNLFAYFDTDSHPAIQEMQREKAEKVMKYTTYGVPLNQVIDAYDLPFDTTKIPWGDDYFISPALVPARWIIDMGPEGMINPPLPEGGTEGPPSTEPAKDFKELETEDEKDNEARKLRIWNNWTKSWAGIEKEYTEAMRKFFLRQQREILDKLATALPESKAIEKAEADDEVVARVVFDLKKEDGKIRAINQIFFDKASELGIRQAAAEAGIIGEALTQFVESTKRNAAIRRALIVQSRKIESINRTTQDMLARQLREGLNAGEGLPDLTNRVKQVLGSNRTRAQSIARTQTGGAVSSGRHVGMKEAGVEYKIWLDAHDNNVRETHKVAGKTYAKGIPINEPFVVGGDFLMHPGDPAGSPANVINCRCVELSSKSGESKDVVFERYVNLKFVSYEDMQIKAA